MSVSTRTAYPQPLQIGRIAGSSLDLLPTMEDIRWAQDRLKGNKRVLTLLVLLKSAAQLGYFPRLTEVPRQAVERIAKHLQGLGIVNNSALLRLQPLSKRTLYDKYHPMIRQ